MGNFLVALSKPIAFHPIFAKCFGNIQRAIYIQQLIYWSDKGSRSDGYIYKTKEEIEEETTLTRRIQDPCRKYFEKIGVLHTKIIKAKGKPTVHYKVNVEKIHFLVSKWNSTKCTKPIEQNVLNLWDGTKCTFPLTENTTENTHTSVPENKVDAASSEPSASDSQNCRTVSKPDQTGMLFPEPQTQTPHKTQTPDGGAESKSDCTACSQPKGSSRAIRGQKIEDQFTEFYQGYPRKVGKKNAFKAFKSAIKRVKFEQILEALDHYKKYLEFRKTETQYIKHPSSWLNSDPWEDEYNYPGSDASGQNTEETTFKSRSNISEAELERIRDARNNVRYGNR